MLRQQVQAQRLANKDVLAQEAIALAEALLRRAQSEQTAREYGQSQKIARLMDDRGGKALTLALVDQAFRSHRAARIADQLRHLLACYGTPRYLAWWERLALSLGGIMAPYLPALVVPPLVARLRQETSNVILPGEVGDLRRYLQGRRAGIVLQAYLPDAFPVQRDLTEWSRARVTRGGAPIMDAQSRQVIGFHVGDRSRKSARKFWAAIPQAYRRHATFYTDQYVLYTGVIPAAQHQPIGNLSRKTNRLERFNNTLRQRVSRSVRSALSLSESTIP